MISLPAFESLRVYHAHTASISSVSISPFPKPLPTSRPDPTKQATSEALHTPNRPSSSLQSSPPAKASPRHPPVPNIPSNQIYIATSSIDGNVCISSLVDPKDVQLRSFGRPVQAVALSPEYKSDRNYLSGGQAGNLVLTTGGQAGRSTNATTGSSAATASSWLGSIGLGANIGTDKVLHSGEGIISTIKWSLTGKYVLWVNERGIKIMRSNLHLESADFGIEWKRLSHTDKPNRASWEDMAAVWKPRAEWFDRSNLEPDGDPVKIRSNGDDAEGNPSRQSERASNSNRPEEAVVGWGDTIWIFRVHDHGIDPGRSNGQSKLGRVGVISL